MKNIFPFFGVLLLFVFASSCKEVDEDTTNINKLLDEDNYKSYFKGEEKSATDQYVEDSPKYASDEYESGEDVQKIKQYIRSGNFAAVIEMNNLNSDESKYYTGIAYYCLMKRRDRFSPSKLVAYRDKAVALLEEVGKQGNPTSLRTRALLWYAMALHLNYSDLRNNRIALGALQKVQRELKGTDVYDDSYLVAALIYTKMGWYVQARKHYRALKTIKSTDGRVWDPEDKVYYSPTQAAEVGLERVRKICYPE